MALAKPIMLTNTIVERFMSSAPNEWPPEDGACAVWSGYINPKGYGVLEQSGRAYQAHRLAYLIWFGTLGDADEVIDHLCRNTRCVNPCHLELVSPKTNTVRGVSPIGRYARAFLRGVCIQGHHLEQVGVYVHGGRTQCAECGRERSRRYKNRRAS